MTANKNIWSKGERPDPILQFGWRVLNQVDCYLLYHTVVVLTLQYAIKYSVMFLYLHFVTRLFVATNKRL
jgi:hypothetical protein